MYRWKKLLWQSYSDDGYNYVEFEVKDGKLVWIDREEYFDFVNNYIVDDERKNTMYYAWIKLENEEILDWGTL